MARSDTPTAGPTGRLYTRSEVRALKAISQVPATGRIAGHVEGAIARASSGDLAGARRSLAAALALAPRRHWRLRRAIATARRRLPSTRPDLALERLAGVYGLQVTG